MTDLRILRLNYNPPDILELGYGEMFEKIEEVTVIKPLMQTFERFILVCEVIWKDGPDLSFLDRINLVDKADEITTDDSSSLLMVSGKFPEIYTDVLRAFFETFECFLEFPARFTEKALTGSIVGTSENINRFLSFAEEWGASYEVLSVTKYQPRVEGALSNLTPKQYHCLETALRLGYFDVKRKIDSRELAKEMGLSHATVLEHIKKGQREILRALFKE
jgi:predicted DNA binding protein